MSFTGAGSCRLPAGHLPNPLNLTTRGEGRYKARARVEDEVGRAKREVERVVPAQEVVEEGELRRVVRLDCNRGTAKCLTITCQVSTNWTSMLHHPHHCLPQASQDDDNLHTTRCTA